MDKQINEAKPVFAQVVFEIALDKSFDYIVPDDLISKIRPGVIINAPFGDKTLPGYVVALSDKTSVPKLKEIISVVPESVLSDTHLFNLAKWISEYYLCPLGLALKAIYPSYIKKSEGKKNKDSLFVSLCKSKEDTIRFIDTIKDKAHRQVDTLNFILRRNDVYIAVDEINSNVKSDKKVFESLKKKGLIEIYAESELILRETGLNKYKYVDGFEPLNLTQAQEYVLSELISKINTGAFQPIVLHGVTGSGKTEIYLRSIKNVLDNGKEAIMLIPEISLTPQTEERFRKRFGDLVAVFHSRLSDVERAREWKKMRDGEAKLVVGARSAVFAPFRNLGLIVVDEEHERSYKQEEAPRYNARDIAVVRAKMAKIPVVLGSATPSLESIYNVRTGKYHLLELPSRVDNKAMPFIHVVDLAKEVEEEKQWVILSYLLRAKIRDRLEKGEQTIIFLNRRGFSSTVICQSCGYVFECKHCSVSLTYHKSVEKVMCHFCGNMLQKPVFCAKCGSSELKYSGVGTQKVERAIKAVFPESRVLRMDSDTTSHKNSHFELLGEFRRGKADILIGTQMIAKGLDFPRVTLVGVILAESSLMLPDFRASESTFQLLTQVSGRAGRGEIPGEVVIQTFMRDHTSIVCAIQNDYCLFVNGELSGRESLRYPPFYRFINIIVSGKDKKKAEWIGIQLAKSIQRIIPKGNEVKGPFPSVVHRRNENYYWNILIKTKDVLDMNQKIKTALSKSDKFSGVRIAVDVDPYYMW